jgi:glutathione S-transferase
MKTPHTQPAAAIQLYDFPVSGHCHRVRLMLSLLDLRYRSIAVDLAGGEHKRAPFLALNPFGQVPVLCDGAVTLADSNAILVYLALRHGGDRWLPRDPARAAAVQRWLSVAAGEVAYGPAAARACALFNEPWNVAEVTARAHRLLAVMEGVLAGADYLAGDEPTLADVAIYSYVAHAPEGGVLLDDYPAVRAWLARVEAWPRFVAMPRATARAS